MKCRLNLFSPVSVVPAEEFISTTGGRAEISCIAAPSAEVVDMQWLINGTLFDNLNLTNVTEVLVGVGIMKLIFVSIPVEYNVTRIRCTVEFSGGRLQTSPNDTLLLLQG